MTAHPTTTSVPAAERDRIAYTVAEVAALLGKHINTVYGWVRTGALPSERVGGTIYIPKWALARLASPEADNNLTVAATTPTGGEAA